MGEPLTSPEQELGPQASSKNSRRGFRAHRDASKLPGFKFAIPLYHPAMQLLHRFLDPSFVSLKICGVTCRTEAEQLATLGVDALGFNFWPHSKRYLAMEDAAWLKDLADQILRVGVFVNQPLELSISLYQDGLIDVVQLHGNETHATAEILRQHEIPFIKALGVNDKADLAGATKFEAAALLLDTHAPGIYGGTGEVFDWSIAREFMDEHPALAVILAGGITPENAAAAARIVRPAALDVASGAEISPGIKDFQKVAAFLTALAR